jgi:hypothetical protein
MKGMKFRLEERQGGGNRPTNGLHKQPATAEAALQPARALEVLAASGIPVKKGNEGNTLR